MEKTLTFSHLNQGESISKTLSFTDTVIIFHSVFLSYTKKDISVCHNILEVDGDEIFKTLSFSYQIKSCIFLGVKFIYIVFWCQAGPACIYFLKSQDGLEYQSETSSNSTITYGLYVKHNNLQRLNNMLIKRFRIIYITYIIYII